MKSEQTKRLYICWYTFFILVCGWGGYFILNHLLKDSYFAWYPAIPVWFYLFGWIYITVFDYAKRMAANKYLFMVYMGMKGFKLLSSLIIMATYITLVQIQKKEFLITYFLFYILSMIFEVLFFSRVEKGMKADLQKKQKE